jgi:hypothetical protein
MVDARRGEKMKSKKSVIVLVTGDRNWNNRKAIERELIKIYKKYEILFVIQGGAPGADSLTRQLCEQYGWGFTPVTVHALWTAQGRAAGPIRNQKMLDLVKPWLVDNERVLTTVFGVKVMLLAFHSDIKRSKGTADMIRRAKKMGLKVKLVEG